MFARVCTVNGRLREGCGRHICRSYTAAVFSNEQIWRTGRAPRFLVSHLQKRTPLNFTSNYTLAKFVPMCYNLIAYCFSGKSSRHPCITKGESRPMSERLVGILVDSFGKILLPGLTVTIPLTAISFTLALIIAVAVALVQFAHLPVLQRLARFYIWVIRGTPVLVQLFVVFYGLPGVGILIEPFPAAVLVFSINEGAYCAETIRAALESVPKGQMEAGQCVGMSYLQIIRRIILPQALRTAFPTLASTLIAMVKDTSLAANITVTEMFMTTQRIVARTYEPLALYMEVGLVYLLFCTVLTRLQAVGERYLNSKGAQRS